MDFISVDCRNFIYVDILYIIEAIRNAQETKLARLQKLLMINFRRKSKKHNIKHTKYFRFLSLGFNSRRLECRSL